MGSEFVILFEDWETRRATNRVEGLVKKFSSRITTHPEPPFLQPRVRKYVLQLIAKSMW